MAIQKAKEQRQGRCCNDKDIVCNTIQLIVSVCVLEAEKQEETEASKQVVVLLVPYVRYYTSTTNINKQLLDRNACNWRCTVKISHAPFVGVFAKHDRHCTLYCWCDWARIFKMRGQQCQRGFRLLKTHVRLNLYESRIISKLACVHQRSVRLLYF